MSRSVRRYARFNFSLREDQEMMLEVRFDFS
jgi:transposase-like protein